MVGSDRLKIGGISVGSIVSWHTGRKNKGIYDDYPVIFFIFPFFKCG